MSKIPFEYERAKATIDFMMLPKKDQLIVLAIMKAMIESYYCE